MAVEADTIRKKLLKNIKGSGKYRLIPKGK